MSAVRAIARLLSILVVGMVAWTGCDRNFSGDEGTLEVTVATLGTDFPPAFRLELSNNIESDVSPNGVYRADALAPGSYTVALTDLPQNCVVASDNPRSITINADETTALTFTVSCLQTGVAMVFETDRDGNLDLYGINLDGFVQPLVQSLFPDFGLTAAANNPSTLAFTRSFSVTDADVFTVRSDGTGLENVTQHPALDTDPALSADGRFLTFVSDRSGAPNLFLLDRTSGSLRQLTDDAFTYENPAFSPTGFALVVASNRSGNLDLFHFDLEIEQVTQLTDFTSDENEPSFSPDGSVVVYTTNGTGVEDIHSLVLATPELTTRLTNAKAIDRAPVFSPDGSFIAFASDRDDGTFDIFLMKPDGSEQSNFSAHPAFDYGPVFIGQ
ncbi:MAG: hypothetical protein AAGJ10_03285 [Bacteroidota bacterium]